MATELNIDCFRGEEVRVDFTVTGLADLTGIPFAWNLLDSAGTVLATLTREDGITSSGGNGTLAIPDTLTDLVPDVYAHAMARTDTPTMAFEGYFRVKAPRVPRAA